MKYALDNKYKLKAIKLLEHLEDTLRPSRFSILLTRSPLTGHGESQIGKNEEAMLLQQTEVKQAAQQRFFKEIDKC